MLWEQELTVFIKTGSELNLISEPAVITSGLATHPLLRPTRIQLALDNGSANSLILCQFTCATFMDTSSTFHFPNVLLKVCPVLGNYDLILGTPFLSCFNLFVSIAGQSLKCNATGFSLFDYRLPTPNSESVMECAVIAPGPQENLRALADCILGDYANLFPIDIPAVEDDLDTTVDFTDGSFPGKMQDANFKVRHKIFLMDHNAIINERQYPYPQKHLVAWRTLLDQHIASGRIRRLLSQYASPSMIIPKKGLDSVALLGVRLLDIEQVYC
jgi:hypothetical protein